MQAGNLFATQGEIIIESKNGTLSKFTITVKTSTYAWKWDDVNKKPVLETRGDIYHEGGSFRFDSPNSVNSNNATDYLPWGLMELSITAIGSYGPLSSIKFTIDLRDEDWANDYSKYPAADTDIEFDVGYKKWTISKTVADTANSLKKVTVYTEPIYNGEIIRFWEFWVHNSSPNDSNFKVPITLMNRTEGGNFDFGYLIANSNEQISSGQNGMFRYNIQNTVSQGTPEENSSGRKYSFKWETQYLSPINTQNIYNSTLNFTIPENKNLPKVTRYFRQVYPLTVKNDLEGLSTSADSIFFKDPTTTNVLEKKSASGAGFVKDEAFANLEIQNGLATDRYALKAQNIIQYGGLDYRWYGGDFNPSTSTDIMVSSNTTKTARYKAHLRSSIQTATGGSGSQRKIAKDSYGNLHMVYESVGKIWYTTSTDRGVTWSAEKLVSGTGTASSPCIASSESVYPYNDVFCVWQETEGNAKNLYIKSLQTPGEAVLLDSDASNIDLQPSIAVSSDDYGVLVAYKKMNAGKYQLHYRYSDDCGYSFAYGGPVFFGSPIMDNNPSIAWDPWRCKFMVSATSTLGYLQVNLFSFDYYNPSWDRVGNIYSSSQIPVAPVYSQVAVDGTGRTHISWIAYDDFYGNNSASMHRSCYFDENDWTEKYSDISVFRDEATYEPSIVYTTVSGHDDAIDGGVSIFYSPGGQTGLYNMVSTNGTSWNGITYIAPSAPVSYPTSLAKAPAGGVTFIAAKGSAMPFQIAKQTVDNTRSGLSYYLKSSSDNLAKSSGLGNTKVFRRIELIDTTSKTPGRLAVQLGNFQGGSLSFYKTDSLKKKEIPISSFMRTEGFILGKDASFSSDLWVKKTGWKGDLKLRLELVQEGSEKLLQKVYEGNLSLKDTLSEEKTLKVVNRLGNVKAYLRLSVEGIEKENLIVNNMDYYLLNSTHDRGQKPEKEITESEIAPVEYGLSQNYPNPFNPTTIINYQIPKASMVTLKVYDMLGREVTSLVNEYKEMGRYSVEFNASGLPSGTYIYEIRASDFVKSGKMLLLK